MIEGRLPKPTGAPSAKVLAALRCYAWLGNGSLRRRRMRQARLTMLLEEMTTKELAHYYKGAQEIRNRT